MAQRIKNIRMQRSRTPGDRNMFNSLRIQYPLKFFHASYEGDWRGKAQHLISADDEEYMAKKPWLDFSLAQDQEDVWLYENWFYGMKNGVIMESGALDGLMFSTSYFYETFANWTALHVEADPENYRNLQGNRLEAVNIHAALCSEPKLLHYSSEGVIPVRGFIEFMAPSFIKKWHGRIYNNKTSIDSLPTVQCLTVKRLAKELNIKHVDIWILDTEGSEESVLRGVDFDNIRFNAIAMECDEHDLEKNARKLDLITKHGYTCYLVERNCMCKNDLFVPSKSPFTRTELSIYGKVKKYTGDT